MDTQLPFDKQIEAYFTGSLSPIDKKAFEESLRTNEALQEAFKQYQVFDKAIEAVGEQALRTMTQKIMVEIGPLPEPKLSIWEQISLFFTKIPSADMPWFQLPQWRIASAGLATIVLPCVFYANFFVLSYDDIPVSKGFWGEPESGASLGGDDPKTAFSDCETLFKQERLEDLQKKANVENRTVATAGNYYLAHLYLKNKNFDAAIATFDKTLLPENVKILHEESKNIGTVKINRLLAILGKTKDKPTINRLIADLDNDPDCQDPRRKALLEAIRKEVNNPWRVLRFSS